LFIHTYFKMVVILSPFFVVSFFLSATRDLDARARRDIILKAIGAVMLLSCVLLFFGKHILGIFGLTLDAFRIGAGAILFLSGVSMVQDDNGKKHVGDASGIAVVPLAVPVIVGPSVTGALLVLGADLSVWTSSAAVCAGLLGAIMTLLCCLFLSSTLDRILSAGGIKVLVKLSGLMIASLAAQMMFSGIRSFLI
jgi:multiple antibiotic resistance protein